MYSVTLAFGEHEKGWTNVESCEIVGRVLKMLKHDYISKITIIVELPKQYRLIITKEESEEE